VLRKSIDHLRGWLFVVVIHITFDLRMLVSIPKTRIVICKNRNHQRAKTMGRQKYPLDVMILVDDGRRWP